MYLNERLCIFGCFDHHYVNNFNNSTFPMTLDGFGRNENFCLGFGFFCYFFVLSKRSFMIHIITRHNSQFTHECEFVLFALACLLPWVIIIIFLFLFLKSINTNNFIIWQFHQQQNKMRSLFFLNNQYFGIKFAESGGWGELCCCWLNLIRKSNISSTNEKIICIFCWWHNWLFLLPL